MIIGIIGGSGLYNLGAGRGEEVKLETPFGAPSGTYYRESIGQHTVLFLPRHGKGHVLTPSEINYRANIYGFKKLGVETLISISAVGSLREEIAPGEFVLPDQYIDLTRGFRENTFFGGGVVGHAPFADPACRTLREQLAAACKKLGVKCQVGGVYVCMEGPQFSTRAESHFYRSWQLPNGQATVIGMTALPEARLAREAGLCYQTVAMATDYDCWREGHDDVTLQAILKILHDNVETSRKLVSEVLSNTFPTCRSQCRELMKTAVVTAKDLWPPKKREILEVILK